MSNDDFISYSDSGVELEAFVTYPTMERRPLVILCHAWAGRDAFICEKAKDMADLGYVGFALDMYGRGVLGKSSEENAALKKPFLDDRALLQRRVVKAFKVASQLPFVDSSKIIVLGYGFGGVCALDLARSGLDLSAAISIYGHFDSPPENLVKPIRAKILILHGYKDPISTKEELLNFQKELTIQNVDWQVQLYGNAMHAFATPSANSPQAGIMYHPTAAKRSWQAIKEFLEETFSNYDL